MPESLFSLQACNVIKKEAVAQVFSSQFCEILKNTIFTSLLLIKTPPVLAYLRYTRNFQPTLLSRPPYLFGTEEHGAMGSSIRIY